MLLLEAELLAKRGQRAVLQRLDRSYPPAEDPGHLSGAEVMEKAQANNGLLRLGQTRHERPQRVAFQAALRLTRGVGSCRERLWQRCRLRSGLASPVRVNAEAMGDPEEPGDPVVSLPAKTIKVSECAREGTHCQLLSQAIVESSCLTVSKDAQEVAVKQGRIGVLVASPCTRHEFEIIRCFDRFCCIGHAFL